MPPPKAISSEPRSPPARAIPRSSFSTLASDLYVSPGSRNSTIGASGKDARKLSLHSAQIGAEVSTKIRRGSRPAMRSMRGASDSISPLPAITSYFAEGVSTRIVCTLH